MNSEEQNFINKLGKTIKIERVKKDLTQEKLADRSGLTMLTISTIELGRSAPSIITLSKIAKGLDMRLCDLLNFD